jgi:hypothetical protein
MGKIYFSLFLCVVGAFHIGSSKSVNIRYDKSAPQAVYASAKIKYALSEHGYTFLEYHRGDDLVIDIALDTINLGKEAYSIGIKDATITIKGGDHRGLIYGCISLSEDIRNGCALENIQPRSEHPHFALRAIKFNTPWYSYRPSSAIDQHYETVRDLKYWRAFLDMMVENRFNSLTLYTLHPFPFMIMPKNFPEASPWNREEMEQWKNFHRELFRMASERAIETYIVPFNIFVSPEFSQAHHVALNNYYPYYYGTGDTSEIIKRYIRESITQVLQEYPDLTGLGLTLGEGMAGMTPQEREDWISDTYIEGMRLAGRKVKLIHRIPFSSTTSSLAVTSIDVEKLTRRAIEKETTLDFIQGPIWADVKYNWSHGHSTPQLVKIHGGKMFDTFYNPEPEGYKITYTVRNEDFFALRWGVPGFIRAHISQNSQRYVGGYCLGSETYIPALDYFTAVHSPVDWQYAFQRQWLFYKLWGRLLYNPDTPDEVFKGEFIRRYGKSAENLLEGYSLASSTQLRLASLYDSGWDFTLYGEGSMALIGDSLQYISAQRLISQSPLDPEYVSVKEYIETLAQDGSFENKKITPPILIDMLHRDCEKALKSMENINTENNSSFMYEVADVKTWANLGLHLAEKLEGALALQTFFMKGDEKNKVLAVNHLEKALEYWDRVITITRPLYKDMPLTHYNGSGLNRNDNNLFHWARIRSQVARDVELAKKAVPAN